MSLLSFLGNTSGLKTQRGVLFEYSMNNMLVLEFEFNPSKITRTRTLVVSDTELSEARGGYEFSAPPQAHRASQGVKVSPESLTVKILLDATDRMNAGDVVASRLGIQPEVDIIRTMMEPKSQKPSGAQTLSALGSGDEKGFSLHRTVSVLVFKWGIHMLPVFLKSASMEMQEYLPSLLPYRAEATLTMQVIESDNPFYNTEMKRQSVMAMLGSKMGFVASLAANLPGGNNG